MNRTKRMMDRKEESYEEKTKEQHMTLKGKKRMKNVVEVMEKMKRRHEMKNMVVEEEEERMKRKCRMKKGVVGEGRGWAEDTRKDEVVDKK
ncbi:hypothetical protein PoB_006636100 [Plakobranchus ocellatus]|uniref:Uncharacterized protein n=1 Tax=Plakobranchus ocellatus TaxID=259542 RepID=A0AAV4D7C0_9GAST|nr:hypothetical protein PoB_006636100 [Plakobranchus ocellatus]